nr:PREDICTED: uncharacterized protein LOC103278385 [Anolis carolinensis]|eukprot:XP_008105897.1 PREDICTED: uncharacterized protein LOC103278385 [Anolis carolinensis]
MLRSAKDKAEEDISCEGKEGQARQKGEPSLGMAPQNGCFVLDVIVSLPHFAPFKEPESGAGSDEDKGSIEALLVSLHSRFKAVNQFKDPAARELLEAMPVPAEAFARLLQEKEQRQASHETEVARLKAEIQRLQQEIQEEAQTLLEVARLRAENQQLRQKLKDARRSQGPGYLTSMFPWSKTDFHIQVRVTAKTGGCEKQFLKKVSDHLSDHRINLKVEKYREGSGHFLVVFCPVLSRVGTDMDNALEGLQGEPKAVLVMLHHKPKESNYFVSTKWQAQHPAVVRTVHARYTIHEGFYACPMNEEAVAIVAEVLEDHCKGGERDPAIPGAPSKSQNL